MIVSEKFPIGTWIYNPLSDFTPDEVDLWAECGLTCTFTPMVVYGEDDISALIPFLDRAEKNGIKLIANVAGLSPDNYEKDFRAVYKILGGHPALAGFFVMDEPGDTERMNTALKICAVQKKVAPELTPYLNLMGATHSYKYLFEGGTFPGLLKKFRDNAGISSYCFDAYSQLIPNETGINNFFIDVKAHVDAAEEAGLEPWLTPICTAHYAFKKPTEYQIIWQINIAVACGIRGLMWFRYYDRDIAINYHGSPIDQFHHLTENYYAMYRAQRIFALNYGEIFLRLKHQKTYCLGKQFADYPMFTEGSHELISISCYLDSIVSFFEDGDGTEYLALANASMVEQTSWPINYDPEKCTVTALTFNGKAQRVVPPGYDEEALYPGQMSLYRIDRKN